jgi:hypothetical protein
MEETLIKLNLGGYAPNKKKEKKVFKFLKQNFL